MTTAVLTQIPGWILFKSGNRRIFTAFLLGGFVLIAYLTAVGPRWNLSNPIHVDEWTHLAYADAIVQQGHVPHTEPLYGLDSVAFRPELGFRVALAELQLSTGIGWEDMFPILPGILFVAFAVAMLYLGYLIGAGPFVGIVALGTPTTIRFLGPSFVIPVALALTLLVILPIILLQRSQQQKWRMVIPVSIILIAILFAHPLTALIASAVVIAMAGYLAMQRSIVTKGPLLSCVALGFLVPLVWFLALSGSVRSELLTEAARTVETGQGVITNFAYYAGYFRISLFTIAVFSIIFWKIHGKANLPYIAILGAYGIMLLYLGLHSIGILPAANFYDRCWLYLDVIMSIVAGVGLAVLLKQLSLSRHSVLLILKKANPILLLVLIGLIMANAWYIRASEPSYYLASESTTEDFQWIRDNLTETSGLTLLNPLVAVAYPAISGRPVYASAAEPKPSSEERIERAFELLAADTPDIDALNSENIGIVYKPAWTSCEGMSEVYSGVFVISEG